MTTTIAGRQCHRRTVYERDGWACHYCGLALTVEAATPDHIIPTCWGGTDALYNLVTACVPCNVAKAGQLGWCRCRRCRRAERRVVALGRPLPLRLFEMTAAKARPETSSNDPEET